VGFDIFVSKEVGWEMRNESEIIFEVMIQKSDKRKVLRVWYLGFSPITSRANTLLTTSVYVQYEIEREDKDAFSSPRIDNFPWFLPLIDPNRKFY
jgi:hypothetical protein